MMQNQSCECSNSEFDVLSVPTMTAIHISQWTEYFLIPSLNNDAPVEFVIPPQTEEWTDLSQSYMDMILKIVEKSNDELVADTNI